MAGIEVENRGVDAQRHTGVQTVIDDGGYKPSLVDALFRVNSGFLLNKGGHSDHLLDGQAPV